MIADGEEVPVPCVPPKDVLGIRFEFYRHPELYVSDTVELWCETRRLREHSAKPNEADIHPCYLYATGIYNSYLRG